MAAVMPFAVDLDYLSHRRNPAASVAGKPLRGSSLPLAAVVDPPEVGPVCVTSGASFVGAAVVRRLLRRGFSVRIAVDAEGDVEKIREAEGARAEVIVVDVMEMGSLCEAFDGCVAVFHTSGFADPGGISGYTKLMAYMEEAAAEAVVEACARTPSVRKCVFTSSLLACIWQGDYDRRIVDEGCWSDEDLCRDKKLWFALGKTLAERAAWRTARGRDLKLATICPGLVVGEDFDARNPTASIAYLKGGREMYTRNVLATVNVEKVAEAHVLVYEAMTGSAGGRYICFEHIISAVEDAAELEQQLGLPRRISGDSDIDDGVEQRLMLSNKKLSTLVTRTIRCSFHMYCSSLD